MGNKICRIVILREAQTSNTDKFNNNSLNFPDTSFIISFKQKILIFGYLKNPIYVYLVLNKICKISILVLITILFSLKSTDA